MIGWDAQQVALAAGAQLLTGRASPGGPDQATIDSREAGPGTLFVGLAGAQVHGGEFAAAALAGGAWGVLTDAAHAEGLDGGAVLVAADPLAALQRLAATWREHLRETAGLQVIGVTGSTGKTSTKDLLLAVLGPHRRTVASRANFNTEIGLPLELLRAPADTQLLVLEMGMRGPGQIAELAQIARPDVGVIVSLGPVHLELLGSLEAIAAAKAELIATLEPGATAVVPAHEPLLEPHLRDDLTTVTFGVGGDVTLRSETADHVEIDASGTALSLRVDFTPAHLRRNLLAAVAAARAVGVTPDGQVKLALSPGRGQRIELPRGLTLLDDSYNANPMSMQAALDELLETARRRGAPRRAVAVLGDMLELGPGAVGFHGQIGAYAAARADLLITVGPLAHAMAPQFPREHHHAADAAAAARLLPALLRDDDVVLVKASNGVGLKTVCEALQTLPGRGGIGMIYGTTVLHPIFTSQSGRVLISSSAALLLCLFLSPKFIAFLRDHSFGQNIREEGPEGHKKKAGTPTMGGVIILVSFSVPFLALATPHDWRSMGVFLVAIACGLVGFADDYTKIFRKRSLGLNGKAKMIAMAAISIGLWYIAVHLAHVSTSVSLRVINAHIDFGPFFVVYVYLVVAGTSNAVNLTDGLDGLAAGCVTIALLAYLGICFITPGSHNLELLAGCLGAACIGFLWFNSFPASVFMGDTGSLALGGAVAGLAIMTDTSVLLIIIGGIFVIEALSVVIQVFSFQTFRKRVFKMAPIHHHFEMEGWSETKIILRFWIIAAGCGAIGFTLYQISIRGSSPH